MFTNIEQGFQVYKRAVKQYFMKRKEIDEREKKTRLLEGFDYRGSIDWPREDFEWAMAERTRLSGMQIALGISKEEHIKIVDKIRSRIF